MEEKPQLRKIILEWAESLVDCVNPKVTNCKLEGMKKNKIKLSEEERKE